MPRKCVLCDSLHLIEYNKWYLEDKRDVQWIWRMAKEKYSDPNGYSAFLRHFKNHVDKQIEIRTAIEKEKNELYKKVIKGSIQVGDQLLSNLELCSTKIKTIMEKNSEDFTPVDEGILLKYMSETRMTVEQILKWRDQLQVDTTSDQTPIVEQILEIMKQTIPVEHLINFNEAWDRHVGQDKIKIQ